jgi:hypothetical protein
MSRPAGVVPATTRSSSPSRILPPDARLSPRRGGVGTAEFGTSETAQQHATHWHIPRSCLHRCRWSASALSCARGLLDALVGMPPFVQDGRGTDGRKSGDERRDTPDLPFHDVGIDGWHGPRPSGGTPTLGIPGLARIVHRLVRQGDGSDRWQQLDCRRDQ